MIDKVGLLTIRDGRVLLCRKKRGTSLLILPGGKRELGESSLECLARELREELGEVTAVSPELVGVYESAAAGDPGKIVRIELYRAELTGQARAQSEIGELVWFGVGDDWSVLAPSLREVIFPDLIAREILWSAW
ncbi:MAG TPA: NUDIX domain-containing protein [Bryobacteraceae bacterium]|jgi:8-oxo-dGTP diphosphatase|nr:NUDIX domain-containing protein [Bryobacteraceae bacterium]